MDDEPNLDPWDLSDMETDYPYEAYDSMDKPDPLCKCKHGKSLHTYAQDSMFEPTSYLCTACSCGNFQPIDPFEDE